MAENDVLTYTVEDICRVLQIGKTRFYASEKSGMFGPMAITNFGRKKLYKADEIKAWLNAGCPSRRNWVAMRGER